MISRGIVPNLVISQRVVNKITSIARQFIADETGESMVGLIVDNDQPEAMPTIYVMDTISPDEEETLRRTHTFQQGDDLQDEIIWWLQENWRLCRETRLDSASQPLDSQWDVPLRYLGDWHKQPGFMIQPSGGDLMTALAWLDDEENNMEYLLVPIVTLGHPSTTSEIGAQVNYFTVIMDDGSSMRVDWWYIHRDVRVFQPISPRIMLEEDLPKLAGYPWHLTRPDRAEDEMADMQDEGLFVELLVWQADTDIPMELCAFVARPGSSKVLLLVTEHDYPTSAPRAYAAPFMRFDPNQDFYAIFEMFWAQAEPVGEIEGWIWSSDKHLIDYIDALEVHLGLVPPPSERVVQADGNLKQGQISIEVKIEEPAQPDQQEKSPEEIVPETKED